MPTAQPTMRPMFDFELLLEEDELSLVELALGFKVGVKTTVRTTVSTPALPEVRLVSSEVTGRAEDEGLGVVEAPAVDPAAVACEGELPLDDASPVIEARLGFVDA